MSAPTRMQEDLEHDRTIIIDGATGTELERRGAKMHDKAWCAMATVTAPDLLRSVHEDYIRAGARLVTANTYSSNRDMLEHAGLGDRFEELNRTAVNLALEARERCDAADRVVVAGSISHQVPLVGGDDRPIADAFPSPEIAAERFYEMATLLADAGAEMILLEMMSVPVLVNLAIDAVRDTGLPFWVGFSVRADAEGNPVPYYSPHLSAAEMFRVISLDGASAAGIMHSNVNVTGAAMEALQSVWAGPVVVYPDSGYFKMPNWQFDDVIPPELLVEYSQAWWKSGARIFGGCCGLGVEHIAALVGAWGE